MTQSWTLNDWGRKNLVLTDTAIPQDLSANEVLIKINAISLNYRDLIMIEGGYGKMGGVPPIIPLSDGAGKIINKGSNVKNFSIDDTVIPTFFQGWISGDPDQNTIGKALGGPLNGVAQQYMILPENHPSPRIPINKTHFMGPSATACITAGFKATINATIPVRATPSAI